MVNTLSIMRKKFDKTRCNEFCEVNYKFSCTNMLGRTFAMENLRRQAFRVLLPLAFLKRMRACGPLLLLARACVLEGYRGQEGRICARRRD